MKITVKKILKLLKNYEIKTKTDLVSINIYSDGSGSVSDIDDDTIFYFDDEEELIKKITSDRFNSKMNQKLKAEIRGIVGEFCDLYDGDLSNEAVSLLLTNLRELSA